MAPKNIERNFQTRRQLFDFLQGQMQSTYSDIKKNERLSHESNLIKSYILEVNNSDIYERSNDWINNVFGLEELPSYRIRSIPTNEERFYQLQINVYDHDLNLYIDAATDPRFWLAYSISESQRLDRWLEGVVRKSINLDFVWLWPRFLERIQSYGHFRGFGLDYDYRKFEITDTDITTYLKMQLWGGENTQKIYKILQLDPDFQSKVVLSKVRFKQVNQGNHDPNVFAIQDVKYNGKFTARGTDLNTHLYTLNDVRKQYREEILSIESKCSIKWVNNSRGGTSLEGFAIHFLPEGFNLPVDLLVDKIFDGTDPYRLLGFPNIINKNYALIETVDLHTGGKLSIEIHPDVITIYLPENTCGNTVARMYTNLQHTFNVGFRVVTDDGIELFN